MNQILVTEKLYVTPELKRKKRMYKIGFFLSIFAICCLSSICIYAEYDRNKSEGLGQTMIADMKQDSEKKSENTDNTVMSAYSNALVVQLTQNSTDVVQNNNNETVIKPETNKTKTYTATNGNKYDYVGLITIPKIDIEYPILSECSDSLLKVSVCKFWGADPNQVGNLCIAGHNYRRKGKFFSDIEDLVYGDIVQIEDLDGNVVEYYVYDIFTVDPEDPSSVDCTSQLTNGKREVTLSTCTDDNEQRRIVKCTEKK